MGVIVPHVLPPRLPTMRLLLVKKKKLPPPLLKPQPLLYEAVMPPATTVDPAPELIALPLLLTTTVLAVNCASEVPASSAFRPSADALEMRELETVTRLCWAASTPVASRITSELSTDTWTGGATALVALMPTPPL